jgi:alkylhydroperoxidase/carboxymuconolactone decarboxylase family protein YurZ
MESIEKKMGFKPHILETLEELDPEFLAKYRRCDGKLLSDGALSKILMALAVVASKQCEACTVA